MELTGKTMESKQEKTPAGGSPVPGITGVGHVATVRSTASETGKDSTAPNQDQAADLDKRNGLQDGSATQLQGLDQWIREREEQAESNDDVILKPLSKIRPTTRSQSEKHPAPKNKDAREHMKLLRRLGYENLSEVPIKYWEPMKDGETKGEHNSRRQRECIY